MWLALHAFMQTTSRSRVLIVDDCDQQVAFLKRVLEADGCECETVTDGRLACATAAASLPDVILLDVELPHLDGLTICRWLKDTSETALIPVLIMTGQVGGHHQIAALEAGADDFLPKPTSVAALRARLRSALKLKHSIDGLDNAAASILMLASALEARDPATSGHCERLSEYGVALGRRIGRGADDLETLRLGGYLHDLGKVAVPDAVLLKQGPLTAAEYDLMKSHTTIGDRICAPLRSLRRVRPIIRSHHETLDGQGYPDGLSGSAVPMLAQIIGVADVYDALTTDRPYRRGLPPGEACQVLRDEAALGKRDTAVVDEFVRVVADKTVDVRGFARAS